MAGLEKVLKLLGDLDAEEVGQLRARLAALASLGNNPSTRKAEAAVERDPDMRWMLGVFCDVLSGLGLVDCKEYILERNTTDMNAFRRKVPALMSYLKMAGPKRMKQQVLLAMGVELLFRNMTEQQGIAVSPGTILRNMHRLPAVINSSFPGYAEAGLLSMIIQTHIAKDLK